MIGVYKYLCIVCILNFFSLLLLRYNRKWVPEYRKNLNKFFLQLKAVLPEESLVVWNMTMPLAKKIIGGFLVPEVNQPLSILAGALYTVFSVDVSSINQEKCCQTELVHRACSDQ